MASRKRTRDLRRAAQLGVLAVLEFSFQKAQNCTGAASTWVDTAPAVTKGWKAKQGERLPEDLGDLTVPGGIKLPNEERSRCWG